MPDNPYRKLPAVNDLLAYPALTALSERHSHERIVAAVRAELDALRARLRAGTFMEADASTERLATRVANTLEADLRPRFVEVINATGIVLHTNLGRAPLAAEAADAARRAGAGYLDLELDLATGERSSRQDGIREWLCRLTGAEAATAVNNNAAATVIVLRALAQGKEVIVSRGQLIEIGGSFRIPDIMGVSGAILREVGTTNITRLSDFERAIGPGTGALLQVHPSNYRIRGFTQSVDLSELVALGLKHRLPVIDDIGSGAMLDFARFGLPDEPQARLSVEAGADLVLFSGDKLLGGPQAGLIVGKKEWIQRIERDPLMRAFRLDKMTLAALEATLRLYLHEERALCQVPVLRMLGTSLPELRSRADSLATRLQDLPGIASVRAVEEEAYVGGGSLPDQVLPTWVVEFEARGCGENEIARRLRLGTPAVLPRVRAGRVVLDVRTVFREQEAGLIDAVGQATRQDGDA